MTKYALLSVADKTNLVDLAIFLNQEGYTLLSTGGTSKHLKSHNIDVMQVSEFTESPEILDGRVKTLHPKIYGGILAYRNENDNIEDYIDVVVVNLYPFKNTISKIHTHDDAIENIDIGGVSLLRASAKNYKHVMVLTNPNQYNTYIRQYDYFQNTQNAEGRKLLRNEAFKYVTQYDIDITNYFNKDYVYRAYEKQMELKYGCNPHQKNAAVYSLQNNNFPYKILNGNIGYINYLDALQSWNLVNELKCYLNVPCCASFKHTAPAGVSTSKPLTDTLKKIYFINKDKSCNPVTTAYIRARNADPMSSFGDFIAMSDEVDEETAQYIKTEVSDGIIAPSFTEKAFEILKSKKKGNFIIIQGNYEKIEDISYRELFGVVLSQDENVKSSSVFDKNNIVTETKNLTQENLENLIIANVTCKYTPSNSVVFAYDGQVVGVGAGQQNRVDCVKLAGKKCETWFLRQHPKTLKLMENFKKGIKKQDKINMLVTFLTTQRYTEKQYEDWLMRFEESYMNTYYKVYNFQHPPNISQRERQIFMSKIYGVAVSSDAFFPFRDSIDECIKYGVSHIVQPGGSVSDDKVIEACNNYDITMLFSKIRLFLH
tara:strand:- start:3458 stop:5254 length:1797 start_codon:yes stop_codon:yes gene_type:complete